MQINSRRSRTRSRHVPQPSVQNDSTLGKVDTFSSGHGALKAGLLGAIPGIGAIANVDLSGEIVDSRERPKTARLVYDLASISAIANVASVPLGVFSLGGLPVALPLGALGVSVATAALAGHLNDTLR